ncbi:MAG: MBL fold metallo-hydrolase [Chloroflexi bacterium]|nr:MBL fold metallo-hydrolase [Chloroflexota bacterium]
MIFERIKSAGIAHNSYLIGAGGAAAVIDPRRDCQVYLEIARQKELKIRFVLETHRNEDYLIGSGELSDLTGVAVYHGPRDDWGYGSTLKGGEEFHLGKLRVTALPTPGHTPESLTYAVTDLSSGEATVAVFSGDALFVGDTGRVDLFGAGEAPRLADSLWHSLTEKILPLGDGAILFPAHGAGSLCGVKIADRDDSTLGLEKAQNPVLSMSQEEFIRHKLGEHAVRPPYFARMHEYNTAGPPRLGRLPSPAALKPGDFRERMDSGALLIDTREPSAFGAHIPGAYSIWLDGLPQFAGWVLPYDRPLLLVLESPEHLDSALRYLVRIGYDNIAGYLKGGLEGWYNAGYPLDTLHLLSVYELKRMLDRGEALFLLDVRSAGEFTSSRIDGAVNIYVGHLRDRLAEVPGDRPVVVYCNVGRRASLASSLLLKAGYGPVYNVLGSMTAWEAAGFPVQRG